MTWSKITRAERSQTITAKTKKYLSTLSKHLTALSQHEIRKTYSPM